MNKSKTPQRKVQSRAIPKAPTSKEINKRLEPIIVRHTSPSRDRQLREDKRRAKLHRIRGLCLTRVSILITMLILTLGTASKLTKNTDVSLTKEAYASPMIDANLQLLSFIAMDDRVHSISTSLSALIPIGRESDKVIEEEEILQPVEEVVLEPVILTLPISHESNEPFDINKLIAQRRIVQEEISDIETDDESFIWYSDILNQNSSTYSDELGFRRSKVTEDQFSINGEADYCISLGGSYNMGSAGDRFLVVTSTGMYTAIVGDTPLTDTNDMKFIIDDMMENNFPRLINSDGTIEYAPVDIVQGDIKNIYKIDSSIPQGMVFYDVPLSDEVQIFLFERCKERNVPMELALAVIWKESTYRADVISKTNDHGLMQINKSNHRWLKNELGIDNFLDPYDNITAGVHMLGNLVDNYGNDLHKILMVYNQGGGSAQRSWNSGNYSSSYSRDIVNKTSQLKVRDGV